ncbi:FcoT family thioesterase [Streptomyces sp. NPDC059002]|uniref:FcoT family thioesterase n=1 Tax=Streptomyces sp. NPDC059002 TaxID=3346690 RepID=UPI0036AAC8FC
MSPVDEPPRAHPNAATASADDTALLARVLSCYKEHCRYLTGAQVRTADSQDRYPLQCVGQFTVPTSCYFTPAASDDYHCTVVESQICASQITNYLIASAVRDRLAAPFDLWTLDDIWQRQRHAFLAPELHYTYRAPIRSRTFHGEAAITHVAYKRGRRAPFLLLNITHDFSDDRGGVFHGEKKLAITDPPGVPTTP